MSEDVKHWSAVAEDWIAWARTPDHDAFWAYRTAFEDFVGHGTGQGVELGAGEGRICRVLGELGYRMTAVEPVAELLKAAKNEESADAYVVAKGDETGLTGGTFDLVVLYNMLMDVADPDAVLREARRLLAPEGRLIVGVVHPMADLLLAQRRTGDPAGLGRYFDVRAFEDQVDHGLKMHFSGWMRSLSEYADALSRAGLAIARLAEPQPDPTQPWTKGSRWQALPLFLWIEARALDNPS